MSADDHLSPTQFMALGGKRATVDISTVADHLGFTVAERGRIGSGSYSHTGESVTIPPTAPVHVRQAKVKKARVQEYVNRLESGESVEPSIVTDRDTTALHHVDGLHRMVAHRLLGKDVTASVWR